MKESTVRSKKSSPVSSPVFSFHDNDMSSVDVAFLDAERSLLPTAADAADRLPSLSLADKGKLLPKIYCHGGDVAFFGGIDLEYETQINSALYGHSSSHKRQRVSVSTFGSLPDLVYSLIDNRIRSRALVKSNTNAVANTSRSSTGFSYSPRYVGMVQRALGIMLMNLLKRLSMSVPDATILGSLYRLLTVVRDMRIEGQLPVKYTNSWEKKLIDRLIDSSKQ